MNQKLLYITQFLKYISRIEELYKNNLRIHFSTYMPLLSSGGTEIITVCL